MNKKGLSAVVATLLIVVITIAAVLLVWNVVKNNIKNSSTDIEQTACVKVDLAFDKCTQGTALTKSSASLLYTAGLPSKVVITFENSTGATDVTTWNVAELPAVGSKKTIETATGFIATKVTAVSFITTSDGKNLSCNVADTKPCTI